MIMKRKKRWLLASFTLCLSLFAVLGAVSGGFLECERIGSTAQASILQELHENASKYSDDVLVLENTTPELASKIAARLGAGLRMTSDGSFAALTLPQGSSALKVLSARKNRDILPELSLDPLCQIADAAATPQWPSYSGSDPYYDEQQSLKYLNLGDTWSKTRGAFADGSKVKVAIIDSGIDVDHPDFFDKNGKCIISTQSYDATSNTTVAVGGWSIIDDTYGHGTHVAGVIAAQMNGVGIVGIAPEVELLVIKAGRNEENTAFLGADINLGISYAIDQGAHVICMSFSSSENSNQNQKLWQKAVDRDIILVSSAGNAGNAELRYPAADSRVIGVGALAQNSWDLAEYSSYGGNTDVVAPGTVYTTAIGGGYKTMSGTSFSCPTVAAAVALYISQNGVTPYTEVQQRLCGTCLDLGDSGKDTYFGNGALDIKRFLEAVEVTYDYRLIKQFDRTCDFSSVDGQLTSPLPTPGKQGNLQFEGWYTDARLTQKFNAQTLTKDTKLYARWLGSTSGDFDYYEYKSGSVRILAYRGNNNVVQIPDTLDGKYVCEIAPFAFTGDASLRDISLPSALLTVGTNAFLGCEGLDIVRVHSAAVLRGINATDSPGGLCRYADTVLADASLHVDGGSILQRYPHTDTVEWNGISYQKYSDHEIRWTQSAVLTPHIPCAQEGLVRVTCDGCGCVSDRAIPMHDIGDWTVAQGATKTAAGEERRVCLACKTVLETRAIAPYSHLLEFEKTVAALTGACNGATFDGICDLLTYYNELDEEERLLVKSDYERLVAIIKQYNEKAEARNDELAEGMDLSVYVLSKARNTLYAIGYCLCAKIKKGGVTV